MGPLLVSSGMRPRADKSAGRGVRFNGAAAREQRNAVEVHHEFATEHASMGPLLVSSGMRSHVGLASLGVDASMGPLLVSSGMAPIWVRDLSQQQAASMGPLLVSSGMIPHSEWGIRVPSGSFNGAAAREQRNGPDSSIVSRRAQSFNGAAAREQRNASRRRYPNSPVRLSFNGAAAREQRNAITSAPMRRKRGGFNGAAAREQRNAFPLPATGERCQLALQWGRCS